MWPPPGTGDRSGKEPPEEDSEGAQPCPHPDFRLLAPRTEKRYAPVKPCRLWGIVLAAPGNTLSEELLTTGLC